MKVTRIRIFKTPTPCMGGAVVRGTVNAIETSIASVVVIGTDAGLQGCDAFTPCCDNNMVARFEGVEAQERRIAPRLRGEDPHQVARIGAIMVRAVQGHGDAKPPFDAAGRDILGQACGQPVWMPLGGKLTDGAPMHWIAPLKGTEDTTAGMEGYRAQGHRRFRIKVGGDWATESDRIWATLPRMKPDEIAMADANQGWQVDNAIRVTRAPKDLDFILEQPCRAYEECQQVCRVADQQMKLDECVTDLHAAQRMVTDRGAEICCLKVSNLGGLSKARRIRDYLVENRIPVVSEDIWDGEITSSVVAHFATSTPPDYLQNTTDLMNYNTRPTGLGGPVAKDGRLYATDTPGLGVPADFASLGAPAANFGATP